MLFKLITAFCLFAASHAFANINVTTLQADFALDHQCSLAEAIVNANLDEVVFSDCESGLGFDVISLHVSGEIVLAQPLPAIQSQIRIEAPEQSLVLNGNSKHRLFTVQANGALTLSGFALVNGSDASDSLGGGAIRNFGELTILNMSLANHQAKFGGAIVADGDSIVEIKQSEFLYNYAATTGGALALLGNSNAMIEQSYLAYSQSDATGGAIFMTNQASLDLSATSLEANRSLYAQALHLQGESTVWMEQSHLSSDDKPACVIDYNARLYDVADNVTVASCPFSL